MTGSPGLTERDDFVTIAAALQPTSREEGSYRLAFLTATLSMLSARCISDCVAQCRRGTCGETARDIASEPIRHKKYAEAIKHLTCIILYLLSFDQGSDCPEWLADFLASCVHSMDMVVPGTPVATIMGRYGLVSGDRVCVVAARNLMDDLGFAGLADVVCDSLAEYLRMSSGYRSQILYFALSQDREYIEKRWHEIIEQNTAEVEHSVSGHSRKG